MKDLQTYIESGVLELFVLGLLDKDEAQEVEQMAHDHAEIRAELAAIQDTTETMAEQGAIAPPSASKANLMAALDAEAVISRAADRPPVLNPNSKKEDFALWLDQPQFAEPDHFDNLHFFPIAQNEDGASLIVWIKDEVEPEVHHSSIEKFLVLEGACDVTFGGKTYSLIAGDYISIPLHEPHFVKITSDIPCKLIVQRIAA